MPAKKKEPEGPQVEGFRVVEYEGLDSLECMRPKCGFQTFDMGSAKAHTTAHEAEDAAHAARKDWTWNLRATSQVSEDMEVAPDEG